MSINDIKIEEFKKIDIKSCSLTKYKESERRHLFSLVVENKSLQRKRTSKGRFAPAIAKIKPLLQNDITLKASIRIRKCQDTQKYFMILTLL